MDGERMCSTRSSPTRSLLRVVGWISVEMLKLSPKLNSIIIP